MVELGYSAGMGSLGPGCRGSLELGHIGRFSGAGVSGTRSPNPPPIPTQSGGQWPMTKAAHQLAIGQGR